MEEILEVIGQSLHETNIYNENKELSAKISSFIDSTKDAYVIVQWPEVQDLMEEKWFNEEAILETEGKFGSSAYFIPLKRLF